MKPVREELQNILDCMTGVDGGISFMELRVALDRYEEEATDGNEASAEVLKIVARFSRLIDLVQRRYRPTPLDAPFQFEPEEDDGSDEVLGEEPWPPKN